MFAMTASAGLKQPTGTTSSRAERFDHARQLVVLSADQPLAGAGTEEEQDHGGEGQSSGSQPHALPHCPSSSTTGIDIANRVLSRVLPGDRVSGALGDEVPLVSRIDEERREFADFRLLAPMS